MDSDQDIGRRIIALREHHGLSQTAFAESISTANNTLSEYESGARHLPLEKAKRICSRWGASLDWLVNGAVGQPGYELAAHYFPNLPKIELNARRVRPGWMRWGNEAPPPAEPDIIPPTEPQEPEGEGSLDIPAFLGRQSA